MSFWDNVKKMAQPYGDDEYDDYEEEEEYFEDYEEPESRSSRRPSRRNPVRERTPVRDYDDEEEEESEEEEETSQSSDSFNFSSFESAPKTTAAPSPVSGGFRPTIVGGSSASNKQEVVLFRPTNFNDSSKAADALRNRRAVIVNMENVDLDLARRVVDFLSGCVYAVEGKVSKVASSAYLFCPHNMDVVGDLETLQTESEADLGDPEEEI